MIKELFFLKQPYEFKPGILVYPPSVSEVVSNKYYSLYGHLLTYSQEEIEDEFIEAKQILEVYPTPLEFMMGNSYNDKIYEEKCCEAFEFFLHQKVTFLYDQKIILVGDMEQMLKRAKTLEDLTMIKESDFFNFQNVIRECIGKKPVEFPNPNEHPKIKEMKRKARYRDKVKAKQAEKKGEGISLYTTLISICCMGLGINPLNIGEMSYMALDSILQKYQEKEKYQLDIDVLLAGGDSKHIKPKYWIRNFEE